MQFGDLYSGGEKKVNKGHNNPHSNLFR